MSTVTYHKQPGIHKTRGSVPLAGTSHVYTANGVLWPGAVEEWLSDQFIGTVLHVCCGKSMLGDVRVDLYEESADYHWDAASLPIAPQSFDTYLADVPYNGKFQWMHNTLNEAIRIARHRIIWQSWFIPVNKNGQLKKSHAYELSDVKLVPSFTGHVDELKMALYDPEDGSYWISEEDVSSDDLFTLHGMTIWPPRAYFGRVQVISVFDRVREDEPKKEQSKYSQMNLFAVEKWD
jgi:hypothetical protein